VKLIVLANFDSITLYYHELDMLRPFTITPAILALVAAISEKIGEVNANHLDMPPAVWRKSNRLRTIQSFLEVGSTTTLSTDQIADILANKQVFVPPGSILAVKNADAVYGGLHGFKPASLPSFLRAHKLMMAGLMESPGKIRTKLIGFVRGEGIMRFAPEGRIVRQLTVALFKYLKNSGDMALIKSCVFQYELEFIHPFMDGNGRLGRFWKTVILMEQYPVFEFLPVESIIKSRDKSYNRALYPPDGSRRSTEFIEFMLGVILESLEELLSGRIHSLTAMERIERFGAEIGTRSFARKEYLKKYQDISPATASRDLREGVAQKKLEKAGDKRVTIYRFI
jgi:Fic family protein